MMRILTVLALMLLQLANAGYTAGQVTLLTMYGDVPADADLVALRDGPNGSWRAAAGEQGTYGFTVLSGEYSLAILCFTPDGPVTTIYTFTPVELPLVQHDCLPATVLPDVRAGPEVTLSGTITGLDPAGGRVPEMTEIAAGRQFVHAREQQYSLDALAGTPLDLLALHTRFGEAEVRAVLIRDLQLQEDAQLDIDFAGPDALVLERHVLELTEAPGSVLLASLLTCNGTFMPLLDPYWPDLNALAYLILPAVARRACDRYGFTIWVPDSTNPGAPDSNNRVAFLSSSSPPETMPTLPAPATAPCLQRSGTDAALQASWQQQDASFYLLRFTLPGERSITWDVLRSTSLPAELELPQARELPGWPAALALTGGLLNWSFATVSSPEGLAAVLAMMKLIEAPGSTPFGNAPDPAELSLSGRDGVLSAGTASTVSSCPTQ